MRNKTIFWMLQIIMVLLLSATVANAQSVYPLDVDPQIDAQGQLIDENEDTVNPADVCLVCEGKDEIEFKIVYSNCTTTQIPQSGPQTTGIINAFDRDASFVFNATDQVEGFSTSWIAAGALNDDPDTGFGASTSAGKSYIGYCQNATPNYLFAICNCVLKTQFLPGQEYVFEAEVIGDGVYWTNRNLSLFNDLQAGIFDQDDSGDLDLMGGRSWGYGLTTYTNMYYEDNVIRFVVGATESFFCDTNWWEDLNEGAGGWHIGNSDNPIDVTGGDWTWALGYASVKDYINRTYNPTFSLSTCVAGQIPFRLNKDNGVYPCTPPLNWTNPAVNAKVLRTHPVVLFPGDYPVLAQTPYLYLDLPTMMYRNSITQLCDDVYIMITVALPFQGVCSTCCNLPMCSCLHFVGIFGCGDACSTVQPTPTSYSKCLPYITHMLDDGWWDAIAIANMSDSAIAPTITFYAGGAAANYPVPSIAAHSVAAMGLVGDVADYVEANYPSFPRVGAAMYAQVTVQGTEQFDVFSLIYNPDYGTTSYLARCNACGVCADCK